MSEQNFLDAMSKAGIPPSGGLIFDGRLRRYNVAGDKKGRRNGWYRYVHVRDDFAWGVFGCNKRGVSEKWSSKEKREITKYDNTLIRKRQAEIAAEDALAQSRAAMKANVIWARLKGAESHGYAQRKGVGLHGVRIMHNSLVIPLYVDNYIVSLQFINSDGDKRFLTGGQLKGAYYWLGEETDVIYIAEGYSTAASVHEATGCQVVMTFVANNLVEVAEGLRAKLPNKKIIIASDNDQWVLGNPGLSKAQEAGDKIGAKVIWPKFNPEDKDRPTDWNDFHARFGMEKLKEALLGVKKPAELPQIIEEKRWRVQLIAGKEQLLGYPDFDPKAKMNVLLFLENHENFKGGVAYNIFTDSLLMTKCPAWENTDKFMPRELNDSDGAMYVTELERFGLRTTKDTVMDYVGYLARKNVINPPMEYFNSLEWDGVNRLDRWLAYYLGADKQPEEYLRLVGAKWMMGAVSRVYNPGVKFDNVLVLEGKQGIKKTSAFAVLANFGGESYFLEFSGDIAKKDSVMEMQGKIIVEMSELASIKRGEKLEEMKAFITRQVDEYRPPYGRHVIKRPRFFIMGASTNNEAADEYMFDRTGGRRYWPVSCAAIDIDALARDREQLWAEAVARYKQGERTWLDEDEKNVAFIEQEERRSQEALLPRVEQAIDELRALQSEIGVDKIFDKMGYPVHMMTNSLKRTIKTCLAELGYKELPKTKYDRKRVWKKTEEKKDVE